MQVEQRQGKSLKYLTVTPDAYEPDHRYPMVILLHGFGASMSDLAGLCPAINPDGYVYICPNAPLPVELGPGMVGYAWTPPGGASSSEDAQRAEEFLDLLSEDLRGGLAGISPRGEMEEMRAKVFLMHDRGDAFVPYVESLRLRDALQSVTEVRYTEFSLFEHVNPSEIHLSPAFAGEVIKLFRHLYLVLLEVA